METYILFLLAVSIFVLIIGSVVGMALTVFLGLRALLRELKR